VCGLYIYKRNKNKKLYIVRNQDIDTDYFLWPSE